MILARGVKQRVAYCGPVTDEAGAPFSVRIGARLASRDLHEGVPDWLVGPLLDWLERSVDQYCVRGVALRQRISLLGPEIPKRSLSGLCVLRWRSGPWSPRQAGGTYSMRSTMCQSDPDLGLPSGWTGTVPIPGSAPLSVLNRLLVTGGSAYHVLNGRLERRVDETTAAAFERVAATAGDEASMHLRRAWTATYGRDPEPSRAYGEAVRAVEALACPMLLPKDPKPTLGKAIAHLRDRPDEWELVLPGERDAAGVVPLLVMLQLLWAAQRSRHAGSPNARDQLLTEAEAALSLAIALVQWFASGFVHRRRVG